MDTGKLIKDLRLKHNLTQEELGEKLGVQKSAIAKYESGRVENLKRSTIQKLSDIFNVSPLSFLGMEEESSISSQREDNKEKHDEFTAIDDAMMFLISNPTVSAYGGYDFDKMSDEEKIQFANKVARMFRVISEDYKK